MPPMHRWLGWLLDAAVVVAPDRDADDSTNANSGPSQDSGAALCMTSEYNGSVLPKRGLLY